MCFPLSKRHPLQKGKHLVPKQQRSQPSPRPILELCLAPGRPAGPVACCPGSGVADTSHACGIRTMCAGKRKNQTTKRPPRACRICWNVPGIHFILARLERRGRSPAALPRRPHVGHSRLITTRGRTRPLAFTLCSLSPVLRIGRCCLFIARLISSPREEEFLVQPLPCLLGFVQDHVAGLLSPSLWKSFPGC